MKIVVLDSDPVLGCCGAEGMAVLGSVSIDDLSALGEVEVFRTTGAKDRVERCKGAEVVLTNKVPLGEAEFSQLPQLRLVSVLATGVNVIDLEAARRRGITVCNVPGYSTASTAQHAFALLLELTNHVGLHDRSVHEKEWQASETFSYFRAPLIELAGLTLGIYGLGAIGRQVARLGRSFDMNVIACTRTARAVEGVSLVDKETLFKESDVLTLHCPLVEETKHLINEETLAKMKLGALLINCSRGQVVDEKAVRRALDDGRLGGVATDVLDIEPPDDQDPLLDAPRCIITPHIAWASKAARRRLVAMSVENVRAFLEGRPKNIVVGS